jgi:hypothetical protein
MGAASQDDPHQPSAGEAEREQGEEDEEPGEDGGQPFPGFPER